MKNKIILFLIFIININIFAGSILTGLENPPNNNIGLNGDFYINTSSRKIFGPKTNNQWGSGIYLNPTPISLIDTNLIINYKNKNNTNPEVYIGTNILKITNSTIVLNNNYFSKSGDENIVVSTNILNDTLDNTGSWPRYTDPRRYSILTNGTSRARGILYDGDSVKWTNNTNKKIILNIFCRISADTYPMNNEDQFKFNMWPDYILGSINDDKFIINSIFMIGGSRTTFLPISDAGASFQDTPACIAYDTFILMPNDVVKIYSLIFPMMVNLTYQTI